MTRRTVADHAVLEPPDDLSAPTRADLGFRLRVVAYVPGGFRTVLGEYEANSPRMIMSCLRERVGRVAGRFDGWPTRQVRAWLRDADELERALEGLAEGRPYVFQVMTGTGLRYVFTAEPIDSATVPLEGCCGERQPSCSGRAVEWVTIRPETARVRETYRRRRPVRSSGSALTTAWGSSRTT